MGILGLIGLGKNICDTQGVVVAYGIPKKLGDVRYAFAIPSDEVYGEIFYANEVRGVFKNQSSTTLCTLKGSVIVQANPFNPLYGIFETNIYFVDNGPSIYYNSLLGFELCDGKGTAITRISHGTPNGYAKLLLGERDMNIG